MAETSKQSAAKTQAADASKQAVAAETEPGEKPGPVEGLPFTSEDVAAYDGRARGDELTMSDRNASASHLAASNQVPQEGALVTDPPQPVPPADAAIEHQDRSDDKSRTVEYPKDRLTGHAVPNEYPRDAQK